MKLAIAIGIILIGLGVWALAFQGITYTSHKKVIDLGRIQASTTKEKTIPLPPILGGAVLIAGVALVVVGTKNG